MITAIGEALADTGKPFAVTSGVPMGANGQVVTEDVPSDPGFPRHSEAAALPFVEQGVRVVAVHPSRFVHGEGDTHGFVPQLISIARDRGESAYVSNGGNRIQAVHRLDVASLFRLAVEKGTAGGIYQAVGDEGVPYRVIAAAIAGKLHIPVRSIPIEDAADWFGFLGPIVSADNPASSAQTRQALGWTPTHPTLLGDLASDVGVRSLSRLPDRSGIIGQARNFMASEHCSALGKQVTASNSGYCCRQPSVVKWLHGKAYRCEDKSPAGCCQRAAGKTHCQ